MGPGTAMLEGPRGEVPYEHTLIVCPTRYVTSDHIFDQPDFTCNHCLSVPLLTNFQTIKSTWKKNGFKI